MKTLFSLALGTAFGILAATAGASPSTGSQPTPVALLGETAAAHWQLHAERAVSADDVPARLIRYARRDGVNGNLGGEHFSVVQGVDGRLLGFTHMTLALADRPLPDKARTEAVARAFLAEWAPDLLPRMEIHWIDAHDETVRDGGTAVTLRGMKVKARNRADGRWFWVIVGADERPMVFERDIVWITLPGRRQTEQWLHDGWLAQQG